VNLDLLWLFLLGLVTGTLGGYLGIGGGLLVTIVLLEWFKAQGVSYDVRFHLAFGTTLLAILGTAISSSVAYQRARRVLWPAVTYMAMTAVPMLLISTWLAARSSGSLLRTVFVVFCVITAGMLLRKPKDAQPTTDSVYKTRLLLIGVFAGLISGYLGVAGGAIMVPLLILWAHVTTEFAPGTSNTVGVLTTGIGAILYAINGRAAEGLPAGSWGFVVPSIAIPILIGTVIGGPFGTKLNRRFGKRTFRYAFAVFLLIVAAKIFFKP
jgi:uncharacterized membrane protein YfcA